MLYSRHNRHVARVSKRLRPENVAERLALGQKTVSFCQCRFDNETATDNEAGMPKRREPTACTTTVTSPGLRRSCR